MWFWDIRQRMPDRIVILDPFSTVFDLTDGKHLFSAKPGLLYYPVATNRRVPNLSSKFASSKMTANLHGHNLHDLYKK